MLLAGVRGLDARSVVGHGGRAPTDADLDGAAAVAVDAQHHRRHAIAFALADDQRMRAGCARFSICSTAISVRASR
mgnify:CR=1 FL=1